MRVCVAGHQGLGDPLAYACEAHGHRLVHWAERPDVFLVDFPSGWGGQKLAVGEALAAAGTVVCGIPHGANPLLRYDGLVEVPEWLAAEFVMAEGHAEVMRRYGFDKPLHVLGWYPCELQDFTPVSWPPRRVLFAPEHPWTGSGGTLLDAKWQGFNRAALMALCASKAPERRLYMYGTPDGNFGSDVWTRDPVEVVDSPLTIDAALAQIDWADLVIASGTFAYLAVARGKPTVMTAQPREHDDLQEQAVASWDAYADYLRFPYVLDSDGPDALQAACTGGPELDEWHGRFIGEPFDAARFVRALETLVRERRPPARRRNGGRKHGRQKVKR